MTFSKRNIFLILAMGWFLGAASGLILIRCLHPLMHRGHGGVYRNRIAHELHLSPEQTTQVDVIIERNHEKLDKIFAQDHPAIEAVRQQTHQEIRAILTPDQQAQFDIFQAKMKKRSDRQVFERLREPSSER